MYRFHKWGLTHIHPNERDIPSQRCSELFTSISEENKMDYLRRQANRNGSSQYLAFDSTSISSYSTLIKQVKYGKNKEGDKLPQLNLLLLYGQESLIPVYYRKLPGNVTDVMVVSNMLKDIDYLNIEKLKFVFDRGFYSEKNINNLMKHHHKFICGTKLSLNIIKKHLDESRSDFNIYDNYNDKLGLYMKTFTEEWIYKEEKVRSGEVVTEPRRIYVHIYYSEMKASEEKLKLNRGLSEMEECIKNGIINPADKTDYSRFFDIHETPNQGVTYAPKNDAIRGAMKNFGYFSLISNDIKDPVLALEIYRNKDTIEKSFGDLKDRLSMRRMSVSSDEGFEGKLFVQFVALTLLSYIKKKMDENSLFKNYTIQSLLDELDIIEYYHHPGKAHHVSEITSKQKRLYECMEINVPT